MPGEWLDDASRFVLGVPRVVDENCAGDECGGNGVGFATDG